MGKIHNNDLSDIKVKVPRRRNDAVCGAEVVGFLSCLDANNHNEASCVAQMKALSECMEVAFAGGAMGQRRHKPPTNYHIRQVRIAVQLSHTFIAFLFLSAARRFFYSRGRSHGLCCRSRRSLADRRIFASLSRAYSFSIRLALLDERKGDSIDEKFYAPRRPMRMGTGSVSGK